MKKTLNYDVNSRIEKLLKLLIACSFPVLTLILSNRFHIINAIVGSIYSLVIAILIMFGNNINIKVINKKYMIITTIISSYMMKYFLSFFNYTIKVISEYFKINTDIINGIFGILALPSLVFIVYKFIEVVIPQINEFIITLTNVEKKYIRIIFSIAVILSIFTIYTTTAFTKPDAIDVIYTTDSADLLYKDVYFNVSHTENDIRQPLFGFFALPFSVLAKIISEFIFFVPKNFEYEFVMVILQFLTTTITTILIARLLKLEEKDKKWLYMLFSFSFPYLIFNLVLEQYCIALFYLILTIYSFYNYEGVNYAYIGATGTLVTSGILFPLITKFRNLKQYVKDILKCLLMFISIFVISGQFSQLIGLSNRITFILGFAKPLPLTEKFSQFFNFIQGIFFSCKGEVIGNRYWLQQADTISAIGVILLAIMIISVIINRKESMARLSFVWVIFSILILVVVGWGTTENGLILYSLYFAWAYLCLYYLFLRKLCKNNRKIFITLLLTTILIMAFFNLKELLNIMLFAIRYH